MKYLKSATNKSYVVMGKIIPPAVTRDNKWLEVSDAEYISICKLPAIASLIKANAIIVSERKPTNPNEGRASSTDTQEKLAAAVARAAEADKLFNQLQQEANAALSEKDAEIALLKEQLEKATKKKGRSSEDAE